MVGSTGSPTRGHKAAYVGGPHTPSLGYKPCGCALWAGVLSECNHDVLLPWLQITGRIPPLGDCPTTSYLSTGPQSSCSTRVKAGSGGRWMLEPVAHEPDQFHIRALVREGDHGCGWCRVALALEVRCSTACFPYGVANAAAFLESPAAAPTCYCLGSPPCCTQSNLSVLLYAGCFPSLWGMCLKSFVVEVTVKSSMVGWPCCRIVRDAAHNTWVH
jgi:hypothetical protein